MNRSTIEANGEQQFGSGYRFISLGILDLRPSECFRRPFLH